MGTCSFACIHISIYLCFDLYSKFCVYACMYAGIHTHYSSTYIHGHMFPHKCGLWNTRRLSPKGPSTSIGIYLGRKEVPISLPCDLSMYYMGATTNQGHLDGPKRIGSPELLQGPQNRNSSLPACHVPGPSRGSYILTLGLYGMFYIGTWTHWEKHPASSLASGSDACRGSFSPADVTRLQLGASNLGFFGSSRVIL